MKTLIKTTAVVAIQIALGLTLGITAQANAQSTTSATSVHADMVKNALAANDGFVAFEKGSLFDQAKVAKQNADFLNGNKTSSVNTLGQTSVQVTSKFMSLPLSEQINAANRLALAGNGTVAINYKDCAAPVIVRSFVEFTGSESAPVILRNKFEVDAAYARGDGVKQGEVTYTQACVSTI